MAKVKNILLGILIALMLTSCNNQDLNAPQTDKNPVDEDKVFNEKLLESEEGIKEYLKGEWTYDYYSRGDVISKMIIDDNLNVKLAFTNNYSSSPKGFYSGKITLNRIYAANDEAPDMLSIKLNNEDDPGGDFFFLHRSNYANKRVMSLFFAGNGNTIFDLKDPLSEYQDTPEEMFFEKITGEVSTEKARISDDFYAVFWGSGKDSKSLWLDDVWWQTSENDPSTLYPWRMNVYENDIYGSVLYKVDPQEISEVLGDEMPIGEVYYIKTNKNGEITYLIDADKKDWIDSNYLDDGLLGEIMSVLEEYEDIRYYLNLGMDVNFESNTMILDGIEYYEIIIGTSHEDYFVNEIFYAVDIDGRKVLEYDVFSDTWLEVEK